MSNGPENIVLALLREVRAKQDEHSANFRALETRVQHLEKQFDDLHMAVTYSLGQSTETQFRQAKQGARIDEPFSQLEKLLASERSS